MRNEINKMVADVKDQMHRKVRPRFPPVFSGRSLKRQEGACCSDGGPVCIAYFESACHEMIIVSSYILEHRDRLSIAIRRVRTRFRRRRKLHELWRVHEPSGVTDIS